jgi:hypothetical protein
VATFGTPSTGNPGQTPDELQFQFDIDSNHGGTVTVSLLPTLEWDANDHVVLESFIAAVTSDPDWTFVGGTRHWGSTTQEITP